MNEFGERFLAIFEDAEDLVLIINPDGGIVFANRALRDSLGYSRDEIQGLTMYDVTRPEDHASCQAWLQQACDLRPTPKVRIALRTKPGKRIFVEGTATARMEGGQIVLLHWVFRDLTEWYRAEATHREREELFHLLTLHAPVGIFRTDADGRLSYANELWRRLGGFWHQPQPRGVWWQMVHPEDRDRVVTLWQASVARSREFICEFRVNAEGQPRWVRARLVRAQLSTEAEPSWIGTTEDITARRQAEEALRQANDDLEARVSQRTSELAATNNELAEFAYVVTHDLKAPLRGIQQLSEWLLRDQTGRLTEDGTQMLGLLRQRVQHLQQLVDGLLACARVGRAGDPEAPVPLRDLVHKVAMLLAPPEHVKIEVPSDLPVIIASPERIQQVFQNLLDNAVKYLNKPAGRIRVSAQRDERGWEFVVADNGPGIPAKYHEKVFQIFQRLHTGSGTSGTGLGLTLVKRIIESRGGRVWIVSEEEQGTAIHFTWLDHPVARI